MLGHALFNCLSRYEGLDVHATARSTSDLALWFSPDLLGKIRGGVDSDDFDSVVRALSDVRPAVVINCIGMMKQQQRKITN
jgi:dTDP-4-dehydrorhamnose reductase